MSNALRTKDVETPLGSIHFDERGDATGVGFSMYQNAQLALQFSNRGYVIETGEIALADNSANLLENEQVKKAYLGE